MRSMRSLTWERKALCMPNFSCHNRANTIAVERFVYSLSWSNRSADVDSFLPTIDDKTSRMSSTNDEGLTMPYTLERGDRIVYTYCLNYVLTGHCYLELDGHACAYEHELPSREYIRRNLPHLLSSWPPTWSILPDHRSQATADEQSSSTSHQTGRETR